MTPDLVLDSSLLVKLVIPEADTAIAERITQDVTASGGDLIAIDFALVEVGQALWKLFHRRMMTAAEVSQRFGAINNGIVRFVSSSNLITTAIDLATRYDRAVYDMLFVALAVDRGLPALTADEPLWKAVHSDHPQIQLLRLWQPVP